MHGATISHYSLLYPPNEVEIKQWYHRATQCSISHILFIPAPFAHPRIPRKRLGLLLLPQGLRHPQGLDRTRPSTPTSPTTAACQAGDDDVEQANDCANDGLKDGSDAVNDSHKACTDCLEDGFDLK